MAKKFEKKYRKILCNILENGLFRNDRTGVGSFSLFNVSLKVNIEKHFPIITGRKIFPKVFNTEFEWFIKGETNIKRLQDNKVTIWDAWADENGDLGPVYGHQLRNWNSSGIDQLDNVIQSINSNPDGRRHIVSLWNVEQLHQMALPPCYLYFQFFVREDKLDMFVVQRSGDMLLGVPYDMCLFARILMHVAKLTGKTPSNLEVQIIDAHIYQNQIEAVFDYLDTKVYSLPKYFVDAEGFIKIPRYKHGPIITAPVAV
jgi:thymidylate synthase